MAVLTFLNSTLGRWLVGAGVALLLVGAIYAKGRSDGKAHVQAKWDAAVEAAIQRGAKARSDAERSVDSNGNPVGMSDDQFNRDRGAM